MRDGELTLGKVTYQQNVSQGKSSYSRIGYEFKTSSGQLIQDQAKASKFSVYEDIHSGVLRSGGAVEECHPVRDVFARFDGAVLARLRVRWPNCVAPRDNHEIPVSTFRPPALVS
jgi:hypothetical protein